MNDRRVRILIERTIAQVELRLSGLVVLTEAATGAYAWTPLIALLAGANSVLTLARDSRFGRAREAQAFVQATARRWGLGNRLEPVSSRRDRRLARADIVTNLAGVRPLNAPFLQRLKSTVAIPLMWETWEYRPTDLDLAACRRLGIPVLGTNEHHPALKTFEYLGPLALKLLLELDIEMTHCRVVVLGSDEFAQHIVKALAAQGVDISLLDAQRQGVLRMASTRRVLERADALVIAEHHSRRALIGPRGELTPRELAALNAGIVIAHLCGGIDRPSLEAAGLRCHPARFAPPGYMSVATGYLGPRPVIELHAAGLKVGEALARARARGLTAMAAEQLVLDTLPLAQGFPQQQDGRLSHERRGVWADPVVV